MTATPVTIMGYVVERHDVYGDTPTVIIRRPGGKIALRRTGTMSLDHAEAFIEGYENGNNDGVEEGEELFKRRNWSPI